MQETSNVNDISYISLDQPKLFLLDDKATHQQKIVRMTRLAMAIMPEDWVTLRSAFRKKRWVKFHICMVFVGHTPSLRYI